MNIEQYIKNNSLTILVKPNSSKNGITGYDDARAAVKVNIKAPAEDNKANIEVVKFFRKLLGREIKILSGLKGKIKILKVIK
jgi:uncharacterized protein (TIGR00251 family)